MKYAFFAFVFIFVAGALALIGVSGTEWANPLQGKARAQQLEMETRFREAQNQIELDYQRQKRIQDLEHQRELNALKRHLLAITWLVLLGVIAVAILAFAIAFAYCLILQKRAQLVEQERLLLHERRAFGLTVLPAPDGPTRQAA